MLQQAKQDGDDVAGTPFTPMHTQTAMDYLDADKAQFERGGDCSTTIPDLEVAVEKHYAWDLPLIVGGVATNNGGHPWGFLASVNDLFKTAQADEDQHGPLHAVHPDALGGGLTYTSIHELSHFLGLAHPHDTIGMSVVTQSDGTKKTEYWDGFSWTFDSTAAPTTYAFDQMTYSILDQETIARGHLAYYLQVDARGARRRRRRVRGAGPHDRRHAAGERAAAPPGGARRDGEGAVAVRRLRLRERDVRGAEGVDQRGVVPRPRAEARARARPRSSTART